MPIPWKHAGIATLALIAATGVRSLLDPWLAGSLPYVATLVAIVYVAWRTGTAVALASTFVGWLVAAALFVAPRGDLAALTADEWTRAGGFLVVTLSIVFVTDRMRHAQRRSRFSEQQLDLISNRLPALISYVGADRRYVWCNDEYTRWFGLAREQIVGRTLEQVLGPEFWPRVAAQMDAAFEGRVVEYETEARYAHGGTRWIRVIYTPHKSAEGAVLGLVAMVTDISDRKRAERRASLIAKVHDMLSRAASVNEAAQQVAELLVREFGLSRCLLGQVEGDPDSIRIFQWSSRSEESSQTGDYRLADFLSETEQQQVAGGKPLVIDDVAIGRSPEAVARYRALGVGAVVSVPYVSEGQRKFALAAEKSAAYHWREDEVEFFREVAAVLYAQFDRARAEQAVYDSERRYRLLASVLTDIPCAVDGAGRFLAQQETWLRYTGQTFEQASGYGWFAVLHPDDRGPTRSAWEVALRTGHPFEVRARLWHVATAQHRHVIARATPLVDERGEIREWVGAITDIHEETEQALALIDADRRKDEFLATLAHELRNPLAPIRNGLYILKATGKAEGALANVHAMLERQVRHLVRLVDDLLEVSRITRGRVELRKEFTDVQAVIASAVEASKPAIDEAGHVLTVNLPPQPLPLCADPVRLAQVLTNLLNNAAKFTERCGNISVSASRDGMNAVIAVRDDGRGIAPEKLSHIFDLFAQAEHGPGGLGIGLTLARRLVELHGGTIEARSEGLRRGSEFTVRLPLDSAGPAESDAPAELTDVPAAAYRVLVVDDNKDAADSLGILLALQGFETRTAYDGHAALETLDDFRPAVILLDLGMPGMSGYEVAERVRQHPHGTQVVTVALSGWGQARDRERTREAGIAHHLVKPVDPEALRELLSGVLKGARAA